MKTTGILLSILVVQALTWSTQGQSSFTYQGRLQVAGTAANGLFDLQFTLYGAATGGGQVGGTVGRNAVPVSNGLFAVSLDFGAGVFDASARWLQVGVKSNAVAGPFTALSPRQQITPAPEAIFAQTAGTVPAGSLTSTQLAAGAVTSGKIANGNVVRSINFLTDVVAILPGEGMSLNTANNTLQFGLAAIPDSFLGNAWKIAGNTGTTAGVHYIGTADNQPLEFKVNNVRVLRLEDNGDGSDTGEVPDGAPNLIGGASNNLVPRGVVGVTISGGGATNFYGTPRPNTTSSDYGTIGGGLGNTVGSGANFAVIGGGYLNSVDATSATIAGGEGNVIETNSASATIPGGSVNRIQAAANAATISGGSYNTIMTNSESTTIGGGFLNTIESDVTFASIGGGVANRIRPYASYASVAGGGFNTIDNASSFATVGGGERNTVRSNAPNATIAGGRENMISESAQEATIAGGSFNRVDERASACTIGGGSLNAIRSSGMYNTIAGGYSNEVRGSGAGPGVVSTIAGGQQNRIVGYYCAIGGGMRNSIAVVPGATIAGGQDNVISGEVPWMTIGGGMSNYIGQAEAATIGGGRGNRVLFGAWSTIGGGQENTTLPSARHATIPGGRANEAGTSAFAAGTAAKAIHRGAFVWADSTGSDLSSTADNSMTMRASGGYRLFSDPDATVGVYLASGSGSWIAMSDRNAKENFETVQPREVLEKVAALRVQRWSYKAQGVGVRHIGPTAQDFKSAFKVGESDTGISTVDADGVALAAIQGLNQKVDEQNAEIGELRAALKAVIAELTELKKDPGGK